jgi:hypothetical protein
LACLEFTYSYYYKDFEYAFINTLKNTINEGILLTIVLLRTSRLKINKRKYFPLKIQSPIYYTKNNDEDFVLFGIPLKIRGENKHEFRFLEFMGEEIMIFPVKKKQSIFSENKRARLLKKYFMKNDVVIYLLQVYDDDETQQQIFLLKPKTHGVTLINNLYPVGELMRYENPTVFQQNHLSLSFKQLKSIEYVYLKHNHFIEID